MGPLSTRWTQSPLHSAVGRDESHIIQGIKLKKIIITYIFCIPRIESRQKSIRLRANLHCYSFFCQCLSFREKGGYCLLFYLLDVGMFLFLRIVWLWASDYMARTVFSLMDSLIPCANTMNAIIHVKHL